MESKQLFKRNLILPILYCIFFILTLVLIYYSYDVDALASKKERMLNRGATEGMGPESEFVVFYILLAPVFLFHFIWLGLVPYVVADDVVLTVNITARKIRHFRWDNIEKVDIDSSVLTIHHKLGYKAKVKKMFMRAGDFDKLSNSLKEFSNASV